MLEGALAPRGSRTPVRRHPHGRESGYSRVRMTRGLRDSGALGCGCARVAPGRARTGGCGT
eukprot:scaffold109300_cov24-Phaeocystis_antarctica.AAC.2